MPETLQSSSGVRRVVTLLAMVMLIVSALYFGRELLIPLAMAVLVNVMGLASTLGAVVAGVAVVVAIPVLLKSSAGL